jgi:hypothetical protein
MSYSASTLAQEAVFNDDADDPSGSGENAAIWMAGGGVAVDASGNLYFATGNGDYGPNTTTPVDFGCSIVKLSPPSGGKFPPVADWFTPHNQSSCNDPNDLDVGSGGLVLLPTLPSGKQLLAQMGKPGTIYEVEIDNDKMGHYCNGCSYDSNIFGEVQSATKYGVWGTPVYWNGFLYWGGDNDNFKAFSFNTTTGAISTSPVFKSSEVFSFPGGSASVSSHGTTGATNGIVWVLDNSSYKSNCCAVLYAYQANNGSELYNTNMVLSRDQLGGAVKFAVPTIANGKVYVGGNAGLTVYGNVAGVSCSASESCQPPYGGTVTANISLTCNASSNISASATACGSSCNTTSQSGNTSSLNETATANGSTGFPWSCSFSYCYNNICH